MFFSIGMKKSGFFLLLWMAFFLGLGLLVLKRELYTEEYPYFIFFQALMTIFFIDVIKRDDFKRLRMDRVSWVAIIGFFIFGILPFLFFFLILVITYFLRRNGIGLDNEFYGLASLVLLFFTDACIMIKVLYRCFTRE